MALPELRGKLAAASPVAVDLSSERRGRQFLQSEKCGLQVILCDTGTGPRTANIFGSTIFCVSLEGCLMRQTS